MKTKGRGSKWTVTGLVFAGALALLTGCGGGSATAPDDPGPERTTLGIEVRGTGPESHSAIDAAWTVVNQCWAAAVDGERVRVEVLQPETKDRAGAGVIRFQGTLCYGARVGNVVYVAPDLRALRHEFSHLVAEAATGAPVENGNGKCWL